MTHFHYLCHGKCALRYVGGFLEQIKLFSKRFNSTFDAKKAHFRGLIAKICYFGRFGHFWVKIHCMCWHYGFGQFLAIFFQTVDVSGLPQSILSYFFILWGKFSKIACFIILFAYLAYFSYFLALYGGTQLKIALKCDDFHIL